MIEILLAASSDLSFGVVHVLTMLIDRISDEAESYTKSMFCESFFPNWYPAT